MNYVEKQIVTRIAKALLAEFKTVTVCGERGYDPDADRCKTQAQVLKACEQYDEVHIFTSGTHRTGYGPWVYLIFGNGNNGWDVVTDYITSLEPVLQPVNDWIQANED
jgi:hypothetical protein